MLFLKTFFIPEELKIRVYLLVGQLSFSMPWSELNFDKLFKNAVLNVYLQSNIMMDYLRTALMNQNISNYASVWCLNVSSKDIKLKFVFSY